MSAEGSRDATRHDTADRVLAERVLAFRDPMAFRELYRRHTPSLLAMATRLTDRREDAEDAVHDAWVRGVEHLGRFAWRSSLRTWLTGILINCVREQRWHGRAEIPLDDQEIADDSLPPLPNDIDRIDLERAVTSLPNGYRQVLALHDLEGFTHEEIAGMLGIEPGTSKSQLARARRSLRRALKIE
ncbi:MAG TPA: RNA polymerase sigma factor [Gemmatimonadaceae bacterium]|nr:RNA polymerase sigma factor [Gemmatimonadaceae bacterium]